MKKSWLIAALSLIVVNPALSDGMPARKPVYKAAPPPIAYSWSGFYVGANLGYGWGRAEDTWAVNAVNINIAVDPIFGVCAPAGFSICLGGADTTRLQGVFGGLQAGYNWQVAGLVTGVEADFQLTNQKGSVQRTGVIDLTQFGAVPGTAVINQSTKLDWFSTVRARAGIPIDGLLVYGTGGLAFGAVKTDVAATATGVRDAPDLISCLNPAGCAAIAFANGSDRRSAVGWALGAGVEAMTIGNWSLKLEYLHIDLGKVQTTVATLPGCYGNGTAVLAACLPVGAGTATSEMRITNDIVRVGLNYRLGGSLDGY